jgi:hypothetical protein
VVSSRRASVNVTVDVRHSSDGTIHSSNAVEIVTVRPDVNKYLKLLKMGMKASVVAGRMLRDGVVSSEEYAVQMLEAQEKVPVAQDPSSQPDTHHIAINATLNPVIQVTKVEGTSTVLSTSMATAHTTQQHSSSSSSSSYRGWRR